MLHMMTATHGPDTCPAAVPEIMEMAMDGLQKMGEVAKSLDITVQGGWANMPAHVDYVGRRTDVGHQHGTIVPCPGNAEVILWRYTGTTPGCSAGFPSIDLFGMGGGDRRI